MNAWSRMGGFGAAAILACFMGCFGVAMTRTSGMAQVRMYEASLDDVYVASLKACRALGLEVIENDRDKGYLKAARGASPGKGGWGVDIFLEKLEAAKTQVRVESHKTSWSLFVAVSTGGDHSKEVLDEIARQLKPPSP